MSSADQGADSHPDEDHQVPPDYVVSEKYARDLWCPEVRRLYCDEDGSGAGINRRGETAPAAVANCIGAKCAFWQFHDFGPNGERGFCGKSSAPLLAAVLRLADEVRDLRKRVV